MRCPSYGEEEPFHEKPIQAESVKKEQLTLVSKDQKEKIFVKDITWNLCLSFAEQGLSPSNEYFCLFVARPGTEEYPEENPNIKVVNGGYLKAGHIYVV